MKMTFKRHARRAFGFGVCLTSLLALQVGSSLAQNLSNNSYPYFAGPYAGINAGYAFGDADWDTATLSNDIDGGTIGAHIGYGIQLPGGLTLGLELSGNNNAGGGDQGTGTSFSSSKIDWLALANAKIGYAEGPTHLYLMGGYARARVNTYTSLDYDTSIMQGWNVGAGLEYAFDFDKTFGISYNYIDLGDEDFGSAAPRNVSIDTHLIRAFINVKLAPPQAAFGN